MDRDASFCTELNKVNYTEENSFLQNGTFEKSEKMFEFRYKLQSFSMSAVTLNTCLSLLHISANNK